LSFGEGRRIACRKPGTGPGQHASPFGSVVTGSREQLPPRLPSGLPAAMRQGGLPRYEPDLALSLARQWGKSNLPDKEFRYLRHSCYSPVLGRGARSFVLPPSSPRRRGGRTISSPERASGVWPLRIPAGIGRFPADCPHRTHCHCPADGRVASDTPEFPAYSQI